MATIKSYTDLEQSKKLAEILPLESADAFYIVGKKPVDIVPIYGLVTHQHLREQIAYKRAVPCWSLAALLAILPEIQGGKPVIALDDNYITYPHMSDLYTKADNLVDACVVIIERLHELNLL